MKKNKKIIVLSGCFYGTNYGDHLFCDIFTKFINKNVKVKNPSQFIQKYTNCEAVSTLGILKANGVVFASGGYMGEGDSEPKIKKIRRLKQHYIPAICCRVLKIPYCIIGVGVGPNKGFTKRIIKFVVNGAEKVTVRDIESKQYLESYGVKRNDIIVTTDTAVNFPLLFDIKEYDKKTKQLLKDSGDMRKVFFHVDPSNFVNRDCLYKEVLSLTQEDKNIYLIVGTDMVSNVLNDKYLVDSFFSKLPKERSLLVEYKNPLSFTSLLKNVDTIITHKLHVGILGTTFNKSVISLPIHNKTIRYYKQLNIEERCLPLKNVSNTAIKSHLNNYLYKDYVMDEKYRNNSYLNLSILNEFIKYIN